MNNSNQVCNKLTINWDKFFRYISVKFNVKMRSFLLKCVIIVLLLTMLFTVIFSVLFGLINAYPDAKAVAEISTSPMVITPLGNLQGSSMKTKSGKLIYAFRGIPYAKPPVGELRFKVSYAFIVYILCVKY